MGCTVINGAIRSYFDRKVNSARPTAYKVEVFCDGQSTKWTANLANNEVWIDGSALNRQGINMGVTMQYTGAGSCHVYASTEDRAMVRDIQTAEGAALVAAMTGQWADVGNLTPGNPVNDGNTYEIYRLVFTGGAGSVTFLCV